MQQRIRLKIDFKIQATGEKLDFQMIFDAAIDQINGELYLKHQKPTSTGF
ncbi:hypothetical protein ACG8BF_14900 (plasmid) [Enterococcus faecalis]